MSHDPHHSIAPIQVEDSITRHPVKWFDDRLPLITFTKGMMDYPSPRNLNYMWNFGSLALVALILQIVTGIFLAMHYKPDVGMAFDSIQHIMRDVNWGWLVRNMHMVGASFFFVVVYIHMARGLYYGSYKSPREVLWGIGVIIFLLMMATGFLGYVLPWGQMSYWGATVITNLLSVIPFIGPKIVVWLWGGYSVGDPTLNRFYALHFLLPFVIIGIVGLHVWALHHHKSNNPVGINLVKEADYIPFHPYYTVKDIFGLSVYFLPFAFMVFFAPEWLGDVENNIPANPLVTPAHIVPEWYFLPFYAILRAIPIKEIGVAAMFGSILIMFVLPWLDSHKVRSARFRPVYKWVFWLFIINFVILGWCGKQPPEGIYVIISRICTFLYFAFYAVLPLLAKYEKANPIPDTI